MDFYSLDNLQILLMSFGLLSIIGLIIICIISLNNGKLKNPLKH